MIGTRPFDFIASHYRKPITIAGFEPLDVLQSMWMVLKQIAEGRCDFVIGSRVRGEREGGSMAAHQVIAGRMIGAALRLLYGVRYTDMCPFRAIRRDVLMRLGMREETYGWNLEMQMRAARAGLRIAEVPVAHRRRAASAIRGAVATRPRAATSTVWST